jgi:hypothetical protein
MQKILQCCGLERPEMLSKESFIDNFLILHLKKTWSNPDKMYNIEIASVTPPQHCYRPRIFLFPSIEFAAL